MRESFIKLVRSDSGAKTNRNGFIVSIEEDGSCGARCSIWSKCEYLWGMDIFKHLVISANCDENENSWGIVGRAYGEGMGKRNYEVFKIVIDCFLIFSISG
jgi:hypothetical protein